MTLNKCPYCGQQLHRRGTAAHRRKCPITTEDRFWMKVDKSGGPDACWPWMGARVPAGGYGRFLAERLIAAHRYSWILHNGPIESSEIDVMHTCDNPPCCNPKHLRAVTTQENMADAYRKRRHVHGERNWSAKLTEADVREIRRLRAEGVSCSVLAARYGVQPSHLSNVASGRAWKHVAFAV